MSKSELLIQDILRHIEDIEEFISGTTLDQFLNDKKSKSAVTLKLLVIGEAAKRISSEIKLRHPQIEWNKIIRTRNIVAHDYEIVDFTIIWKIITVHIPELKQAMLIINSEF
jgi:uncharacterized protein with HEPN domain